jgi:hypothetical protein
MEKVLSRDRLHLRIAEEILGITGRERWRSTKDGRLSKRGRDRPAACRKRFISHCTRPKNRGAGGNPRPLRLDAAKTRTVYAVFENARMEYPAA